MKEKVDTILFLKIAKDAKWVNMLNSMLNVQPMGVALAPILQIRILRRSGSLALHSFFHRDWSRELSTKWVKETWWTNLTEKITLESRSHISLSYLGESGIGMVRMDCASSRAKTSFTILLSQDLVEWSKRWWALIGRWMYSSILSFSWKPSIHGTQGLT